MAHPDIVQVVIIETQHGCKIVPPAAILTRGEYVQITNMTGSIAELQFPEEAILWYGRDESFQWPDAMKDSRKNFKDPAILGGGQKAIGRVKKEVEENEDPIHFEYSCYCKVTRPHYAEGNSRPRFIVR